LTQQDFFTSLTFEDIISSFKLNNN